MTVTHSSRPFLAPAILGVLLGLGVPVSPAAAQVPAVAQTERVISGVVIDAESHVPLAGAV
ncbi:MAG: hypothetical protein ABI880_08610, partial [Acidobacteriota bacterium]